MSVLWKKIEFYKGKSYRKAIVIAAWGLRQSPSVLSGGQSPELFGFLMSLRRLNGIKLH